MIYPVVITPQWRPVLDARTPTQWGASSSGDIPTNAIYANNEPIPDPSGTGYLTYEV